MIKHKVYVKRQRQGLGERNITSLCRRVVKAALDEEGIDVSCEVSVLVTDDKGIQAINLEHRGRDKPTDVLSFPMHDYVPGHFQMAPEDVDPETGNLHLGDIVVSVDRVDAQAKEYGHGPGIEMAYLVAHATLHLLGYDHEDEGEEKRIMRQREKRILGKLSLLR